MYICIYPYKCSTCGPLVRCLVFPVTVERLNWACWGFVASSSPQSGSHTECLSGSGVCVKISPTLGNIRTKRRKNDHQRANFENSKPLRASWARLASFSAVCSFNGWGSSKLWWENRTGFHLKPSSSSKHSAASMKSVFFKLVLWRLSPQRWSCPSALEATDAGCRASRSSKFAVLRFFKTFLLED